MGLRWYLCGHRPCLCVERTAQLQLSFRVCLGKCSPRMFGNVEVVHIPRHKTEALPQDTVSSCIPLMLPKPQRCVLARRAGLESEKGSVRAWFLTIGVPPESSGEFLLFWETPGCVSLSHVRRV